jgi:hypothetical protein
MISRQTETIVRQKLLQTPQSFCLASVKWGRPLWQNRLPPTDRAWRFMCLSELEFTLLEFTLLQLVGPIFPTKL